MARILFLAPQPFFQERGTPIAIDLALQVLEGDGHEVDLLTYPEGEPRRYQRVQHHRIPSIPGIHTVKPGFSWKKIIYSSLMTFSALRLTASRKYDVVHAVEEACFIALLLKWVRNLPYIFDMDSSIARQLTEKKEFLKPFSSIFKFMEGAAIRHSLGVVAVCPSLGELATMNGAPRVLVLQDISLLHSHLPGQDITDLRNEFKSSAPLLLYIGNLEHYQGIDLLIQGFSQALKLGVDAELAIIGGSEFEVAHYRRKVEQMEISERVRFFGSKPIEDIGAYLEQADILVSPRSVGDNTPMKIYTYLGAGKALLATKIQSHTQALDDTVSLLVNPTSDGIATGIQTLCTDSELRRKLGESARMRAEERHSFASYRQKLTSFYRNMEFREELQNEPTENTS